ncbi:DUF3592 domain-containing protein [Aquitalea pelogenes]|uniref:DUF3592 domain-containing protein n=1 Tax=Aquitalea pelogenes TaxID=1293573 RepID=UPI0035B4BFF2
MKQYSRKEMISAWLFILTIVAVGFAFSVSLLYLGLANFHKQKVAAYWPVTEGVITSVRIQNHGRGDMIPVYTYKYTVNNKQYSNDRQSIGEGIAYSRIKDVQLNMKKHPTGSTIPVHYDPESPEDSTISISFDAGFTSIVQALMGLLMSVASGCILFYLLRPNKKISTLSEQ